MSLDSANWRYFSDIEVGEERQSDTILVVEEDIINFAKKYDPQWFHLDAEVAKDSNFNGLIASGIHVAALWRMLDHEINGDIKFVCGIGWDEVRWKNPLRPGDEIYVKSKCLSKKDTSSKDRGIAVFDHSVNRKDGTDILVFIGTSLIYKKWNSKKKIHN